MIHVDTISIDPNLGIKCYCCELPFMGQERVVRQWLEFEAAPGYTFLLALMHRHCAKDLGSDMAIEKGR